MKIRQALIAFGLPIAAVMIGASEATAQDGSYVDREAHTRTSRLDMPPVTRQRDFVLPISDIFTTHLTFPGDVVAVDHGSMDLMAQTLDVVRNIVKVKATSEALELTSLTVITDDHQVYTFRVFYDRDPATIEFDMGVLSEAPRKPAPVAPEYGAKTAPTLGAAPAEYTQVGSLASAEKPSPRFARWFRKDKSDDDTVPTDDDDVGATADRTPLIYGETGVSNDHMQHACAIIAEREHGPALAHDRATGSQLTLDAIFIEGDIIYYRFTLENETAIAYDVDVWRLFVRDAKTAKRAASQEVERVPLTVFCTAPTDRVEPFTSETFVVALDKFTIPDEKRLHLELIEEDGGRHHEIKLSNREIVGARYAGPGPR